MTNPNSWEERMSARAKQRADERYAEEKAGVAAAEKERQERAGHTPQPWMNGWPRMGLYTVLIGTGVHCVCCGHLHGITCVAITSDWEPPGSDPDWPFSEDDCPIRALRGWH